jgi:hypothetical protein
MGSQNEPHRLLLKSGLDISEIGTSNDIQEEAVISSTY